MKVNFYDCFKDFDGQPLHINGEPQLVSRIVAQCLFNGTGIRPSGNQQTDADKKLRAYRLCMQIMDAVGEIDITAEDAVLIKEAVSGLTPGCYSQVVQLIEK
ncbi:TerB family tellurite resistance protein [Bacteroides fragilis]|jgi:hypothetical protein|uniref:TerB family tellurite resistance protein n=1 Tax=Bacteroidaceae TaxID=815 RepID=UPI000E52A503|nr:MULTISPECIES: TerB family tellurite resistance protein [Bacteroidaceae]MCS2268561.1 TerB family tellurite resistance protein [Bacteroides fragilis]DAH02553.1 MAG TPA: hypothetical protein [Caudoviricetes sp.]MCS2268747.1 TerB family tellurite resistance protein [Bacteroides fragilis]MCS2270468.1 TerB family tellurite resistance protein [Bacteroides fragilis]MCS2270713.1 TerB family tellurite resistance protein [Bacteroides fragilis]